MYTILLLIGMKEEEAITPEMKQKIRGLIRSS